MKKLLAAALTVASLAFASPSLAQTPPNVLVVGQIAEPKSLDPSAVTAVNDFRILVNIYDGWSEGGGLRAATPPERWVSVQ